MLHMKEQTSIDDNNNNNNNHNNGNENEQTTEAYATSDPLATSALEQEDMAKESIKKFKMLGANSSN